MQLFWISCIFCCAVPLYLMPAIRQAREQTLGLGEGGKKFSPFSKAGLYFQRHKNSVCRGRSGHDDAIQCLRLRHVRTVPSLFIEDVRAMWFRHACFYLFAG